MKNKLKAYGFKTAFVSARRIDELRNDVTGRFDRGAIDADFYKERLAWFDFKAPDTTLKAASLIVIAVPRPQTRVRFRRNGASVSFLVPPTYARYDESRDLVTAIIAELLAPAGFKTARTLLPDKLIAVRSGLADYGRNNIAYVPGMGSFCQLITLYSDLPCVEDDWRDSVMMESCANCRACLHGCPTGAIDTDRFLLHAERCLVYHNERGSGFPFPSWIDPSWHECPVGCMKCQQVCPKNRKGLRLVEDGADFSAAETEGILAFPRPEAIGTDLTDKLKRAGLADYLEVLPRNVSALFLHPRRIDTIL